MSDDRVVTFDAACSCGLERYGFWSAEEAGTWADTHECKSEEPN